MTAGVLLLLVYFVPFIQRVDLSFARLGRIVTAGDGFAPALVRSFLFAVIQSALVVVVGAALALALAAVPLHSTRSRILTLLLLPALLGNVSTAFVWKILLANHPTFFQSAAGVFLGMTFIQLWQYGTLLVLPRFNGHRG